MTKRGAKKGNRNAAKPITKTARLNMACYESERASWESAAGDVPLQEWVRATLNKESGHP